ncbi:hypothetical protein [Gelidibacter gilvus]|uniref:Uncharacterized protein n=1 Tax=Gelidibacter gilvus TaxID=59602 RepID=A0A4Q0XLH3_9FLAO|nr:hypothetical protein [Gelidibacter gilvus]RXJ51209.1 hypothetical protein ESZ48_04875 [Gelidibacter gilvus]
MGALLGSHIFHGVVEVDITNGKEIEISKKFDRVNSFSDSEIIFSSETNESLVDLETIYKINVELKPN